MLSAARDWNYLAPELDWHKLRLPVEELQRPQRFFTPEESQRIIDASPEPWNICFAFMAYLGLRTSEAVGVAWENIDLPAGVLRVKQSNWRKTAHGEIEQHVIYPYRRCWWKCWKDTGYGGNPTRSDCFLRMRSENRLPVVTCAGTSCTRYASDWELRAVVSMPSGMVLAPHWCSKVRLREWYSNS